MLWRKGRANSLPVGGPSKTTLNYGRICRDALIADQKGRGRVSTKVTACVNIVTLSNEFESVTGGGLKERNPVRRNLGEKGYGRKR